MISRDSVATGNSDMLNAEAMENACTASLSEARLAIRVDQSDNQASKCCSPGTLLLRREINKFDQSKINSQVPEFHDYRIDAARGMGKARMLRTGVRPGNSCRSGAGRWAGILKKVQAEAVLLLPKDPISQSDLRSVGFCEI